jgi:hypothetical protein
LAIVAHQLGGSTIATEGSLQRALEHAGEQAIELLAERAAVYREHQGAAPAFETKRTQTGHGQLATEMVEHFFHRGGRGAVTEPLGDTSTQGSAEAPTEVGDGLVSRGAAQVDQRVCRDEDVLAAAIHATSYEVEAHGTGGVEAGRHRFGAGQEPCADPARRAASIGGWSRKLSILVGFLRAVAIWYGVTLITPSVQEALTLHAQASSSAVHELELRLAALLLEHAPVGGREQLELAERYLAGQADLAELRSAQQDCWSYVGSLACGCSVADSASGAAFLACLNGDAGAHTALALAEQAERALRAGVSEEQVLAVLTRRVY